MAKIKKIIIHCSDSPDHLDIGVREIRQWHVDGNGWSDIGYHYVVRRNGTLEPGRHEDGDSVLEGMEIGAHVRGHNSDSLAICWVGRQTPTKEQITCLRVTTLFLLATHNLPVSAVYGHYEFDKNKTCPNMDMHVFRFKLNALDAYLSS